MELRQYFDLLRKWLWLILLCTVVASGLAFVVSRQQTPIYQATSRVLINQARSATRGAEYADILTSERVARTYAELLQDWPAQEQTAAALGLVGDYRTLARALHLKIVVSPLRDTQLVELSVEASDPELAARIANTLPGVFGAMNQERQRERYADTRQELQAEVAALEADISSTQQAIERLRASVSSEDQAELARLQSALKRHETSYSALLNSLEELRLAEAQTADNILLATPAQTPGTPIRPRLLFNILLAASIGALLAIGLAFLLEYLDDSVKTPDDVRDLTGLPTLGAVIALNGSRSTPQDRLVALNTPRSPAAEAYRVLRTNLQFSSLDKPLRSLVITSPGPGEGKSTTASNLAVVMAQAGKQVVLLDADLRRPNIHKLFRLPNTTGLTTALLQGGHSLDGHLRETNVPGLLVITTGPIPPNPAELLSSERMHELIEEIQGQCDVLIIDSPPVLAVADAAILSNQVDGALMVISSGETSAGLLVRALERLDSVGVRPLGVVLNKLTERKGGEHYYYYYHYASRYGSSEESQPAGPRARRPRSPEVSEHAS